MTDPRDVKPDGLPTPEGEQDRRPSIFRGVVLAIIRFLFSTDGVQVVGGAVAAVGAFLLLPIAVWLIVVGIAFAALGALREAGRI